MSKQINNKDIWDKSNIVIQAFIALIALAFTLLFNFKQQENAEATLKLTSSNLKISEVQIKSSLLPLLSSNDPKQRTMAMYLAKALDEEFAAAIANVISINDPDSQVRKSARTTLVSLALSKENDIRQKAEKSIVQYDIVDEMRAKGLLKDLDNAEGFLEGGNFQDKEKALQIYRKVLSQLSKKSKDNLEQKLMNEANKDFNAGYNDNAISKYRALFSNYTPVSFDISK
jgi:hypothetical protein